MAWYIMWSMYTLESSKTAPISSRLCSHISSKVLGGAAESRHRQQWNLKLVRKVNTDRNPTCLATVKDTVRVFEDSELSDAFPGIPHHVADDLWLNGVTALPQFHLCLVLEVRGERGAEIVQTLYSWVLWVSYHWLAFTLLTLTGEIIRLSQPVVAIFCGIQRVYVADEHLREKQNKAQTLHTASLFMFSYWLDVTDTSSRPKNKVLNQLPRTPHYTHTHHMTVSLTSEKPSTTAFM